MWQENGGGESSPAVTVLLPGKAVPHCPLSRDHRQKLSCYSLALQFVPFMRTADLEVNRCAGPIVGMARGTRKWDFHSSFFCFEIS